MFRYLTPREGTETKLAIQHSDKLVGSDTLLPERGRKLQHRQVITVFRCIEFGYLIPREGTETVAVFYLVNDSVNRSDTLLPARGRKQQLICSFSYRLKVQIPYSPQGAKKAHSIT